MYCFGLRSRQKESQIVEKIGDIFLEAAQKFGDTYINYNGNFPIADFYIRARKQKNSEFDQFLKVINEPDELFLIEKKQINSSI